MASGSVLILILAGLGWINYRNMTSSIATSDALADEPVSMGSDQNILLIGLDSRLDQQGRPLPRDIYDALHAGDETSGDYDADVLMVLHIPGGGGPVTAVSIPRDDYVDLAGCPASVCEGKIKHAYSLAYHQVVNTYGGGGVGSGANTEGAQGIAEQEQTAREAGRKATIRTIRNLLQIPIDHFVEVTLVGFLQIARVVEPITVCLNEDTSDIFSGAHFHKGIQQINAAQATAFVRQRRDANDALFTDLDRTRRQQAFIAALVDAVSHSSAWSSPTALRSLMAVAEQYIAVDSGFDLGGFIHNASALTDSPFELYTLPVTEFRQNSYGEDINVIDVPTVRAIVSDLMTTHASPTAPTSIDPQAGHQPNGAAIVLNVINASNQDGIADALQKSLSTGRFTEGTSSSAGSASDTSSIEYGPGAQSAAIVLAHELDLRATASNVLASNTVQLTVGTDFGARANLGGNSSASSSPSGHAAPVTTVSATGIGIETPAATDLTRMMGDGVPCVK